jgi:1,4-dihydroxy-2-naphthoate octaprenyltransferase
MKNFILAARPKTLLAGAIPPLVAYSYYRSQGLPPQPLYLTLCVLGALFIQIATNFFNDVIDHERGADVKRVGPTRVSAAGLVRIETVRLWAYCCVALATACGTPLILRGGWPILIMGLISVYLTYGYTGGKAQLAYRGLGELFVYLFFGLFSVMGSYYIFALDMNYKVFILASQFGLLATTLIGINNLRDRETDSEVGKRTMATKMSEASYKRFIIFTIFFPYVLTLFFLDYKYIAIMLIGLVPAFRLTSITLKLKGAELNLGLKVSGIHLIVFAALLSSVFLNGRLL